MNRNITEEMTDNYEDFILEKYLEKIVHSWLVTLNVLAFSLVPLFFILDIFIMPKELLFRFGSYRAICTLVMVIQYFIIKASKPGRASFLHAYILNFIVSIMIVMMTSHLGGFNSSYYAGLNLVIMAVNSLLPWRVIHSVLNSILTIVLYVVVNLIIPQAFDYKILINNLYFLISMGVIAVGINSVKFKLIIKEFHSRVELKEARDQLWSEMKIAEHIQTALLPENKNIPGYEIAATMVTADEVGGDYYDIITTKENENWIAIGDVSGHGVDSGLVMLMAQTSIFTVLNNTKDLVPSTVISYVNSILRENISRLKADKYMTVSVLKMRDDHFHFSGKHQDILIYRLKSNNIEEIESKGTWIGISDNIIDHLADIRVEVHKGDIILLFTDGVTEAVNSEGDMFGEERLEEILWKNAGASAQDIVNQIVKRVEEFQEEQYDDITLVVMRKL